MKKILIIEDEKFLAEMYKEKLESAGFEIFLATDCQEGLKLAKEKKPDLILLDILLPGEENGVSFLRKSKEDPKISQIPIVAFSNFDDPKTKKEALFFGAKEYLIKTNYTPQEIVERIKNYLK